MLLGWVTSDHDYPGSKYFKCCWLFPALMYHMEHTAPLFENEEVLKRCLEVLSNQEEAQYIFNKLEGSYVLCMIGNLIHLSHLQLNSSMKEVKFPLYTVVLTRLLCMLQEYVSAKQSNMTTWHPILGWFAQTYDPRLSESLPLVKSQLFLLWSEPLIESLLGEPLQSVLKAADEAGGGAPTVPTQATAPSSNIIKRTFFESRSKQSLNKAGKIKLGSPDVSRVTVTCSLYYSAISTFTQLKLDILTGLCYRDSILAQLWKFFTCLGPMCGMKSLLELFSVNPKAMCPEFNTLILFCDLMTHYIIILDDIEMYERQECFSLSDYEYLSLFLNHFLYKCIVNGLFDQKMSGSVSALFHSAHTLLMLLYRRDSRRKFTTAPNHWIIKDCKLNSFMGDLDRGKKSSQLLLAKIPHIVSHEERVRLFRKYVANEKSVLGLTESACQATNSTLISIHRKRLLEDGYRQLAKIPPHALKGIVRVRFINVQGLDEAGIDQDGVFKEFLEETIKCVFDPGLNLFKVTSEERLYPSPTSYLHDSHLQLFEFVGRMLGKAVYEGIVVDVPFASFFLSQVLGVTQQALYSCMDELPSLDTDLYRSLTYIKHYPGDVTDLDLTFSVDEDVMGRLVTHELTPGGKVIPVTNQNKINYIHLMAHFRMHTQIKHQTSAFIKGFKSIINPEWLSLFSTPELQRLISGDNAPLDLSDLRRHTVYYGGFHDSHKVVLWLWDILNKDFNEEERKLFLKFVTSCSKPPLLGFAHLEPSFSIRCVEVTDDEDTGDTIGSVIRGFFTIRKKDPQHRLPTASTCFNLLKLPNYQRKSTLRDKLRYAITSNTGFELS
uniref:Ubiquitin-protein ligase E3B n=1 Tax=Cacopsylla melanoneura TaxID=428564 RepID=A0A8D8R4E0_9HEMI